MAKTFKDKFFELYEPKSPDEKRFIKKHVVAKTKDANGNKDDVFQATNVKMVDRHTEHGYNPGEDEKVYEEVEPLDELSRQTLSSYVKKAGGTGTNSAAWHASSATRQGGPRGGPDARAEWDKAKRRGRGVEKAADRLAKEEVDLQELSKKTLGNYIIRSHHDSGAREDEIKWRRGGGRDMEFPDKSTDQLRHDTKKRRKGMYKAVDKLTKEETNLQELSTRTLNNYIAHSAASMGYHKHQKGAHQGYRRYDDPQSEKDRHDKAIDHHDKMGDRRYKGINTATRRLTRKVNEEEQIDELSKSTLSRYIARADQDAYRAHNSVARGGPGIHRVNKRGKGINMAIDKYTGAKKHMHIVIPEETEELQELSKKTLASYVDKAGQRARDAAWRVGFQHGAKTPYTTADAAEAKIGKKRVRGLDMVVRKLAKEETEELQELSKKTLVRYIDHASFDKSQHANISGRVNQMASDYGVEHGSEADKMRDDANKRHGRRSGGIVQAAMKLAGHTKVGAKGK